MSMGVKHLVGDDLKYEYPANSLDFPFGMAEQLSVICDWFTNGFDQPVRAPMFRIITRAGKWSDFVDRVEAK